MRHSIMRPLLAATIVAVAAYGLAACIEPAVVHDAPVETPSVPDVAYDEVGSLSVASNFAVLGEFVGYVDPERGVFEVRMVDNLDEPSTVAEELRRAHQATTVTDPTGWCQATIDRDGTAGTGAANTVELYTPWGEIDKSIDECLIRIDDDGLSETSFPNGVLCADVVVRSFFSSDLENVYAEITSHTGESNQFGYAYPLGNGAERPDFGRDRPGVDFGLWSYGSLTTAAPERTEVWTFKFGSTTPFTFGGRLVYSVAEDCDNGVDDDCDGIADNACNEFATDATCIIDDDCAGDSFCDGGALDGGSGDADGACKCHTTTGDPYHDSLCSATCDDGKENGAEEGVDCGGPCTAPCGLSETRIAAAVAEASEQFGFDVAVSGGIAVVGGPFGTSTTGTTYAGSAHVFERQTDGSWTATAELPQSDPGFFKLFGQAVALSGARAAVGAPGGGGAVYLFERQSDGSWIQSQRLVAPDAGPADEFGNAVSLDGDRLLVGAQKHASAAGAGYIFERDTGGTWNFVAKLQASDASASDQLGGAVALSGDRALLGAPLDDDDGGSSGSAYVFERQTATSWSQTDKLVAADAVSDAQFGASVSLDGTRALIGAPMGDGTVAGSGSSYVFERQGDATWAQQAELTVADLVAGDQQGIYVGLSSDRAVVSATKGDGATGDTGAAYLFVRQTDGTWTESATLFASDGAGGDAFGFSVDIDGARVIAGAPLDESGAGASYLYDL